MGATKEEAADTRRRLLEAALDVLREHGASRLTLEAVAQAAGVSKGGLLHHFSSKQALIEALMHLFFSNFSARVQAFYDEDSARPGRWLRAYVRATFEESAEEALPLDVGAMLLAMVTEHAALRELVHEDARHWHARLIDDGIPAPRAMVVRQAADAYWTERMLGLGLAAPAERRAMIAELLRLAEPAP